MNENRIYDVIIIGGSYAGLSAAMALGRSLRDVLVIDSGIPCNRQTPHSHNFLTQDGKTPLEIATIAKQQVEQYESIIFQNGVVTDGKFASEGFEISTEEGNIYIGRKLIFATGVKDIFPDIKGFAECWGISVIHCPYCHGYEFKHQKTAILAQGEKAIHLSSLVHNLTDQLQVLTRGEANFEEEQKNKLVQNQIGVIETEIVEIVHKDGYVKQLVFDDGRIESFDAVYAPVPFIQHLGLPVNLGCELTEAGHIKVDNFQKTNIPGVFACGDSTTMMRSVASAVSTGNTAGAMVNMELTQEEF